MNDDATGSSGSAGAWFSTLSSTARVAIGLVLVVIITAWIMRVVEGRRYIAGSDAAFTRGDRVEAIVLARAAAEARCPLCASSELGFGRLLAIAKDAENRGDDATAVASWRAVRAATLGIIVLEGLPERREHADQEIARLEHRIDAAAAAAAGDGSPSPAASEDRLRSALATNTMPSSMVFLMLTVGGVLFLLGAIRFVRAKALSVGDLATSIAGIGLAAVAVLLF